jgi:sulfite exporter TauE/SafE
MDAQVLVPAFLMGLAGSLHCVGMCGPIALSLPVQGRTVAGKLGGGFLYNLGRISTYGVLGLAMGILGRSLQWFAWQQKISILLGLSILAFLIFPLVLPGKSLHPAINSVMSGIRARLAKVLGNPHPAALYTTGLLNGLLPCGLVYMALTGAVITGGPLDGALFMVLFGTGTLPAMFATSLFGQWLKYPYRARIRQIYPALMAIMAILLIVRGLNLGIPFISPKLNVSASAAVECHTR